MDDSAFNAMQVATVPLTLLGEITEPTQVILTEVTLNLADGPDQRIATNEVIVLEPDALVKGDFDGNGKVDFLDFFAFSDAYGNPDADPIYDLDDSGSVDFLDFFIFADAFSNEGRAKLMALAREVLALPDQLSISTSYPNPFNSSTTIEYFTKRDGHTVLEIYSLGGQRLRTLLNGLHPAGRHQAYWNGEDDQGRPVSSGMYLIRLQTANQVRHHKVTLIK